MSRLERVGETHSPLTNEKFRNTRNTFTTSYLNQLRPISQTQSDTIPSSSAYAHSTRIPCRNILLLPITVPQATALLLQPIQLHHAITKTPYRQYLINSSAKLKTKHNTVFILQIRTDRDMDVAQNSILNKNTYNK